MIAQIFMAGFEIAEVTCPTKYFDEASSINFRRSLKYGLELLAQHLNIAFTNWAYSKANCL